MNIFQKLLSLFGADYVLISLQRTDGIFNHYVRRSYKLGDMYAIKSNLKTSSGQILYGANWDILQPRGLIQGLVVTTWKPLTNGLKKLYDNQRTN